MNDKEPTVPPASQSAVDVSPEALLGDFRGRPVIVIFAFTIFAHVILAGVIVGVGYAMELLSTTTPSSLSEEKRMENAVREAHQAFREIAERNQVSSRALSEQMSGGAPTAADKTPTTPAEENTNGTTNTEESDAPVESEPPSDIERELQEKEDGPDLPPALSLEEEDALFP